MVIEENVNLSRYCTYKIGGPADLFVKADNSETLREALVYAASENIPYFLLGGGSNVLFPDEGVRGMVICNRAGKISFDGDSVRAESGALLSAFVDGCCENRLTGMEFLAGIPGSVGGALYGNAGAYGRSISRLLKKLLLFDGRSVVEAGPEELDFSYRYSSLKKTGSVVLEAELQLRPGDASVSREEINGILREREGKHPQSHLGSCGCYFKNVDRGESRKLSAGRLLEEAGAAGLSEGDAYVYGKHCNFILNAGGATASQIRRLAEKMKEKVRLLSGIELEEEVRIISSEPPFIVQRS